MQNKEDSIEVSAVVTIYRSTTLRTSRDDTFYVEIRNVVSKRKGKPILGAARPITKEAMNNIIDLSRIEEKSNYFSSKLLPENLLSFNPDRHNRSIIWWIPKQKVSTLFVDKLNMPKGKLPMPALLFITKGNELKIFSLSTSKRPSLSTELYNAPLLNYYNNNTMCWGSVDVKHQIEEVDKEMKFWEDKLWESEFSHASSVTTTKSDIIKLYRELIKSGKDFPVSELIKANLKLKDVL